jgi:preprotein translocase subunit YajC
MLNGILLLAQESTTAPEAPTQQPQGGPMQLLIMFAIFFVIFYFIALRPRQKEQKKRAQMLQAVKKYDKIMTIGGIVGTVMEVREDEVIVKVDDNNNTRIKFTRGSIQRVVNSADTDKEKA